MSLNTEFRVGIACREVAFGQDCKAVIAKEGIEPLFLGYMLKSKESEILDLVDQASHGTGRLQTSLLESINIPLPPLAEQRKIAAILGTWDAAITAAEKLIAALRARKQALMQRLLAGEVRFPGFEGNWEEKVFSEVLKVEMGGTPSRSNPDYWDSGKVSSNRWLTIADLRHKYVYDSTEYISNLGAQKSSTRLFPEGTVIMSFKLTIGRVAILARPCYTNEAICALIPFDETVLSRKYLYHALSVVDYEREIDQAVKGRTLNKEKLNRLRLYVPCIEEQERIARFCDTLDTEIDLQSSYIRRLQEQKRGLMQRLLTGEVRVEVEEGR